MAQAPPARVLRTAMLWNGTLQGEAIITPPQALVVGSGKRALFPIPEGLVGDDEATLIEPHAGTYQLQPLPNLGGYLWIGGQRYHARQMQGPVQLGPHDYGVVTLGAVTIFFQEVKNVQGVTPSRSFRDGILAACLGLSVFIHVASILFLFLVAAKEFVPPSELELDNELVRKFLIIPPPEELKQLNRAGGTELDDAGLRDRDEAGGKRHERDEGRVGKKDATRQRTDIAGEPADAIAQKVRGLGLLGVLSGGGPSAIDSALDGPSVDQLLGGLGAAETALGVGSGGLGLRGAGQGGGGKGQGVMFGAGNLGTAVGGGKGKGRGDRGVGAEGRQAREIGLALDASKASVSGFLSKEQINRVVRANQAAIKYCFEQALQRQPGLSGSVNVQWRIDRAGHVKTARVAKSTLNNTKVEGCMVRYIKRWKFPEPDGGEVDVLYPFLFRGR